MATSDVDGGRRGQPPAVIDLGLVREPSPGAGGPSRPARRQRRALAAAACLALALGLLSAAGPPAPPAVRLVLLRPFPTTSVSIAGDLLLAADGDTTSAYRLPSGRYAWSAPGHGVATRTAAGPVLAYDHPPGATDGLTRALRPDTGTPVWTAPGAVIPGSDRRTGWTVLDPVGARFEEGQLNPVSVQVRDLASGRLLWSTGPDVVKVAPVDDGGRGALLLARPDGRVEVRDMVTGGTRRTGRLPVALLGPESFLDPVGGLLLAVDRRNERTSGLDPFSFAARWAVAGLGGYACGELICVLTPQRELVGVEPDTGRIRWTSGTLGNVVVGWGDKVLTVAGDPPAAVNVIDPATGRTVGDLTAWRPGRTVGFGNGGDRPLILTRSSQDQPRTAVALLAPGEREPRLLGFLPYAEVRDCLAGGGALACRLPGNRLGIWAYAEPGG